MTDWIRRRWKLVTTIVTALGTLSAAAVAWDRVVVLDYFPEFREVVRISTSGRSLPFLLGQLSILQEKLRDEQSKSPRDHGKIMGLQIEIRQVRERIARIDALTKRYRAR